MPLRSIGFVASNGLTVGGVVLLIGPTTNWLEVLPDESDDDDVPVGADVDPVLGELPDPMVVWVVAPFLVVGVEVDVAAFFAWVVVARLAACSVETVTDEPSTAPVVGGVALTCFVPPEHAPASATTPHTATTVRIPVLPMGPKRTPDRPPAGG
jgi:hypothetical protein